MVIASCSYTFRRAEMGLGKTIQTLGLILSTLPSTQAFYHPGQAIATLIVCPKTVIPVWQEQINRFVNQGSIRMEVYSDERKRRSKIIPRVQNNEIDILIVSYETLACEFGDPWVDKRGNHIPDISDARFYRIVCDECQQIRNNKSKAFKAVMGVAAVSEHRLALTGSPFVNKPEDIHSLLCFVGLQPLDDPATFDQYITEPIKQRKRVGLTKLRAALAYTTLRRTKEGIRQSKDASDKFKIVEKTIHTMSIEFPEGPHKNIHNALYATTQAIIMSSCAETEDGMDVNTGRGLFEMVLRIRQSCASPELVPPERIERALAAFAQIADDDGNVKQLTTQERLSLLEKLQVGSEEDSTAEDSNGCTEKASFDTSPKILALLQAAEKISKDEKGVIFSQWTSFLDLIGSALVHAGHKVCRIDGSMDLESRRLAMHTFATDDEVRFILCSLKAAGTGIDLARANHVFLMDPWWNEAVESQAIDRCHRITSTKPVFVHKLVMKGTIEERMIKIQKAKAMLGKASMQKISKEEEKQAKMTAMKDLFQIESNIVNEKWFY